MRYRRFLCLNGFGRVLFGCEVCWCGRLFCGVLVLGWLLRGYVLVFVQRRVKGEGVVASGALVTGLGTASRAPVSGGSLTGGAEVVAASASCVVGSASCGGLSGSSTVSTVCCPIVSLSASVN